MLPMLFSHEQNINKLFINAGRLPPCSVSSAGSLWCPPEPSEPLCVGEERAIFLPPLLRKRLPRTPPQPLPRDPGGWSHDQDAQGCCRKYCINSKHHLAPKKAIYFIKAATLLNLGKQLKPPPAHRNSITLTRYDHILQGFYMSVACGGL